PSYPPRPPKLQPINPPIHQSVHPSHRAVRGSPPRCIQHPRSQHAHPRPPGQRLSPLRLHRRLLAVPCSAEVGRKRAGYAEFRRRRLLFLFLDLVASVSFFVTSIYPPSAQSEQSNSAFASDDTQTAM